MPSRTLVRVRLKIYVSMYFVKSKTRQYFSRVFCYLYSAKNLDNMANIPQATCIYKITSPSGKVYIGQALNARRRFLDYKSKLAKSQPALNYSFIKHGWDSHVFEIIHYLPKDITQEVLNEYECLYMDLYKSCGIKLLNVKAGGSNGRNSDDSIKKANDKWKVWYQNNPKEGRTWIEKSASVRKGRTLSEDHKTKIGKKLKGRIFSDTHKINHAKSLKGKTKTLTDTFLAAQRVKGALYGGSNKKSINQFNLNGEFIKTWPSITHASNELVMERRGIAGCVKGGRGRKTFGGFIWRPETEGLCIIIEQYIHSRSPKKKQIIQFTKDGEALREWQSLTEAGAALNLSIANISACVRGKAKSAGGFIWKYK